MSQASHELRVPCLPDCSRRGFLQRTTTASLAVVLGSSIVDAGESSREDVPCGVDLESLREDISEGPEVLVARAVAAGWRVVGDETVLNRPETWQRDLAVALERHRVELAAIEAVVDLGRVTFASSSPVVRRGVVRRLEIVIGRARRLHIFMCEIPRQELSVPGLNFSGRLWSGFGRRVIL